MFLIGVMNRSHLNRSWVIVRYECTFFIRVIRLLEVSRCQRCKLKLRCCLKVRCELRRIGEFVIIFSLFFSNLFYLLGLMCSVLIFGSAHLPLIAFFYMFLTRSSFGLSCFVVSCYNRTQNSDATLLQLNLVVYLIL